MSDKITYLTDENFETADPMMITSARPRAKRPAGRLRLRLPHQKRLRGAKARCPRP